MAWIGSRGAIVKGIFFGTWMASFIAIPGLLIGEWVLWMAVGLGILSGIFMGIVVKLEWQPSPRVNRWTEAVMRLRVPGAAQPPYLPRGSTYLPEESLRDDVPPHQPNSD